MLRVAVLVLNCLLLSACVKTTLVVLLPDEEGVAGAVLVQSAGEQEVLDKVDHRVETTTRGIYAVGHISPEKVAKTFTPALQALPEKAESYFIYFDANSAHPTAESLRNVAQVVEVIRARSVPSVELFGHTDHLGDGDDTQKMSDARTKEVRRLLIEAGIAADLINEKGFADRDPLVPQADNMAEPRNRRVEVFIR